MERSEKILLLTAAAFAVASLVFILYLPANPFFVLPLPLRLALYAGAAVPFLLLVKYRQNMRVALVFFWIVTAVFILSLALFLIACGVLVN